MSSTIIVLGIILATVFYFYSKYDLMRSLTTTLAALFGVILAFGYYEQLAGLLPIEQWYIEWIQSAAFLFIFIMTLIIICVVVDFLVKTKIDVEKTPKTIATLVCSTLTGVMMSGVILVFLGLAPLPAFLYTRYPADKPIQINNPSTPIINADGFITSLYAWISRGSLSSNTSFSVIHADYLTGLHLNRHRIANDILAVCSPKAITLPGGKTKPVRVWKDIPDKPPLTVIRVGIEATKFSQGGTLGKKLELSFIPGHFRLITKPPGKTGNYSGTASAIYPIGHFSQDAPGTLIPLELNHPFTFDPDDLPKMMLWLDLAFEVPSGQQPILLQFKQNAMIELPKPVPTSKEIEKALNEKTAG